MSTINIKDYNKLSDSMNYSNDIAHRMKGGPVKTRIIITDHDTGEVLGEVTNKVLVPGSQDTACKQFGIERIIDFPTYNTLLGLQNSKTAYSVQPMNEPITCLWCAGRSGSGSSPNEVLAGSSIDRIEPVNDIMPFRYLDAINDLDKTQRQIYFGRKVEQSGKIGYYFKAFDTEPQLHIRYLDGTEVTENMYNIDSSQSVEVYVEMRLAVTRLDFRDYINSVLGWDKANISTISLVTAWYDNTICENPDVALEANKIYYKWYQDIIPFSKFNFREEDLGDLTRAIDFNYQVYY